MEKRFFSNFVIDIENFLMTFQDCQVYTNNQWNANNIFQKKNLAKLKTFFFYFFSMVFRHINWSLKKRKFRKKKISKTFIFFYSKLLFVFLWSFVYTCQTWILFRKFLKSLTKFLWKTNSFQIFSKFVIDLENFLMTFQEYQVYTNNRWNTNNNFQKKNLGKSKIFF